MVKNIAASRRLFYVVDGEKANELGGGGVEALIALLDAEPQREAVFQCLWTGWTEEGLMRSHHA